jgi:hypothetical protein
VNLKRVILWVVLLAVAAPTMARESRTRTKYPSFEWGIRAGLTGIYNDNPLRLSETDENAFHRYASSFRTPLETTDDGESELSLQPSLQWRAPGNLMVNANYKVKFVNRLRNDFTDYQTHGLAVSARPRMKGYRWNAKAAWFLIPSYYLRVYRDRDLGYYADAKFRNWEYSAEFSYRILDPLWIGVKGASGTYYYNSTFTEFDSEYQEAGVTSTYLFPKSVSLTGGYLRRASENVGKDQALHTVISPEGSDLVSDNEFGNGDFDEDEFSASLRAPLKFFRQLSLRGSLSGKMRRRVYTSNETLTDDPFHRGRLDTRWEVTPDVQWAVSSLLDVNLYFTYEQRSSESDNPSVALVKNFVRREFGVGVAYALK